MTAAILGWLSAIGTTLGLVLFATSCLKAANNLTDGRGEGGKRLSIKRAIVYDAVSGRSVEVSVGD